MYAALKAIGASSEMRHVPAGEPISCISEQGSEGINIQQQIWKYLFAFDDEGVCKEGFTNLAAHAHLKEGFSNPDYGFVE